MKSLRFVVLCLLPFLILFFAVEVTLFNTDFYHKEFSKHNVYEVLPNAENITENLLGYLKGKNALEEIYYTQDEILHMQDVKHLIVIMQGTLMIILLIILITILTLFYQKDLKNIGYGLMGGSIATIMGTFLLFILSFFSFNSTFTGFHKLFFTNDLWLLPASTTLIKLFPLAFFYDSTIEIGIHITILSFVILLLGYGVLYVRKQKYGLYS